MSPEMLHAWAKVLSAIAWPLLTFALLLMAIPLIRSILSVGGKVSATYKEINLCIEPSKVIREPSAGEAPPSRSSDRTLISTREDSIFPFDYLFLNHTSFLRTEKQQEFRRLTGLDRDHYDIRVIVDSYYQGALDRVARVEYVLHESYPEPIQVRVNRQEKFRLKELANGEYVLMAKVYLKDVKDPLLLQRYITLWETGPRIT